jgi:hypothetical protein
MKIYQCDECEKQCETEPAVEVRGITGTSGRILLPDRFIEKHFCSTDCFWQWIRKHSV